MPSFVEHTLDVYGVALYFASNGRQWAAIRKSRMPRLSPAPGSHGLTEMFSAGPVIQFAVYVAPDDDPAELINTCAHEAAHVAGQILEEVGADYDGASEPHAYLVGWVTQWLWQNTQAART